MVWRHRVKLLATTHRFRSYPPRQSAVPRHAWMSLRHSLEIATQSATQNGIQFAAPMAARTPTSVSLSWRSAQGATRILRCAVMLYVLIGMAVFLCHLQIRLIMMKGHCIRRTSQAGQNIISRPPTQIAHKGVCTEEEEQKAARYNNKSATTGTAAATPTDSSAPVAAAMSSVPTSGPATDCAAVTCAPRQKCGPGMLLMAVPYICW